MSKKKHVPRLTQDNPREPDDWTLNPGKQPMVWITVGTLSVGMAVQYGHLRVEVFERGEEAGDPMAALSIAVPEREELKDRPGEDN